MGDFASKSAKNCNLPKRRLNPMLLQHILLGTSDLLCFLEETQPSGAGARRGVSRGFATKGKRRNFLQQLRAKIGQKEVCGGMIQRDRPNAANAEFPTDCQHVQCALAATIASFQAIFKHCNLNLNATPIAATPTAN